MQLQKKLSYLTFLTVELGQETHSTKSPQVNLFHMRYSRIPLKQAAFLMLFMESEWSLFAIFRLDVACLVAAHSILHIIAFLAMVCFLFF